MLTSTGLKKHGSLILLELSEPEEASLKRMLDKLWSGKSIALPADELDIVLGLQGALPKRGTKGQP